MQSDGTRQLGNHRQETSWKPVDTGQPYPFFTSIHSYDSHTCATTDQRTLWCWGGSFDGQLGNQDTEWNFSPVRSTALRHDVRAVSSGQSHTCALDTAGGVHCWGNNDSGQLGNGSTQASMTAVEVTGLGAGIAAVSAGRMHTCAVTDAGGVYCWGHNSLGQLGDGSTTTRLTPVAVSGLSSGVMAIAAGGNHTCALTLEGHIRCWGYNAAGQLGDGSYVQRSTQVAVTGLNQTVAAISASFSHTCALTTSGGVWCWGTNHMGQLGDGTTTESSRPVPVVGLGSGVRAIATGHLHTCALTNEGIVQCWGYSPDGQLGDVTSADRKRSASAIQIGANVTTITAGSEHSCALTDQGIVKCWGDSFYGQIGDGHSDIRPWASDALR